MEIHQIFLDTSYIIALLNPDDKHHQKAKELFEDLVSVDTIWITQAVLLELGDGLYKSRRDMVADFIVSCYDSDQFCVVETDKHLLFNALKRYTNYQDKGWSLTDCISFEVMTDNKITLAYSSDHHFEQAGFQYVLK